MYLKNEENKKAYAYSCWHYNIVANDTVSCAIHYNFNKFISEISAVIIVTTHQGSELK